MIALAEMAPQYTTDCIPSLDAMKEDWDASNKVEKPAEQVVKPVDDKEKKKKKKKKSKKANA